MLPDRSIPRPTFHKVFADVATPEILHWIAYDTEITGDAYKAFLASLPDGKDGRYLPHLLESLSSGAKRRDAFAYCEALKNVLAWPINTAIVEIFARAIKGTEEKYLRSQTIDWVMKTGMRFDRQPGTEVKFHDPDRRTNRSGKVVSVDRLTATGIIATADDKRVTIPAELLVA